MITELKRYAYTLHWLLPELWLAGYKFIESGAPVAGDVVMLQSAPMSDWDLSIFRDDCGRGDYLLESLKTGAVCRWSNVGIKVLSRKWVESHAQIRWTDEQFRFQRLFDAERVRADYYIHLPYLFPFDAESAVIGSRTRFGLDELRTQSEPFDWRKMSRGDLRTLMARQIREHERLAKEAREAKAAA